MSSATQSSRNWREDPGWRVVEYDPELFKDAKRVPSKPTPQAELSTSPVWASLYEGNRIVVTWYRPVPLTGPRATVVGDDG